MPPETIVINLHLASPNAHEISFLILCRSMRRLSFLLASMRQCLPQDISLHLLKGANRVKCLRECLISILEEAKGESEEIEHRIRGEADNGCCRDKLAERRDKTDWTMSMATR